MDRAEIVEAARRAVAAVQRLDYEAATEFIQPEVRAWDVYLLLREAAAMAAQPGLRQFGVLSGLGTWMPDIRPDETPEQVFGLRFVAAHMNGDDRTAEALFGVVWDSMADDVEGRQFDRSFAAVLALAAVYGDRL